MSLRKWEEVQKVLWVKMNDFLGASLNPGQSGIKKSGNCLSLSLGRTKRHQMIRKLSEYNASSDKAVSETPKKHSLRLKKSKIKNTR